LKYFLSFRIFEQLELALKTEFALKFSSRGAAAPPPRTPLPIIELSTVLSSGKDPVPARKRRGVVYEIPFGDCEHKYIGEKKGSLSTWLKEHHRYTLPKNILKNPEKTALTKHAAQSGHVFNWDCAHVLHHVNTCHKCIFLETLHISLKTNAMTDKITNFPAIYHNISSPLTFITLFDWYLPHTFTLFTALLYLVTFYAFLCRWPISVQVHLPLLGETSLPIGEIDTELWQKLCHMEPVTHLEVIKTEALGLPFSFSVIKLAPKLPKTLKFGRHTLQRRQMIPNKIFRLPKITKPLLTFQPTLQASIFQYWLTASQQRRPEGGQRGAGPWHSRPGRHPKSEITKIEML